MNDAASGGLPTQARVVVIGGGVGGASIAYHLAELGETDVVLLERAELTSGSTFHSAGLVGQLRADPTLTRMNMYSVELYRRLQQTEHAPGWIESGGIKLASTPERLEEIRRQISWAQTYDLPLHEISPDEARDRFPLMSTEGVVGACFLDSDGQVDPSQLCMALAALARAAGVTIRTHTRVTAIDTVEVGPSRLGQRRVSKVQTDQGDIACEVVVDAAGMFAAEIARMVDVRVPIVPMSHQYVVTEPCLADAGLPPGHPTLPSLRDPDLLVYFRQEVEGLVMGGYERNPAAVVGERDVVRRDPARLQRPTAPRGVGAVGGDRHQCHHPGARDGGRRHAVGDQRAGGVHAGQRVLPRRDVGRRASSWRRDSARTASPARAASAR